MTEQVADPYLHDPNTGELIGYRIPAEDGSLLLTDLAGNIRATIRTVEGEDGDLLHVDETGRIISGRDVEGQPIDVGELYPEFVPPDAFAPEVDEEYAPASREERQRAELEDRIAASEARVAEREIEDERGNADFDYDPQTGRFDDFPRTTINEDEIVERWGESSDALQRRMGRKLTNAEWRTVVAHATDKGFTNLLDAYADLLRDGHEPFTDPDDPTLSPREQHQARVDVAVEHALDRSGETGDLVTGEHKRSRDSYDFSIDEQRQAYAVDKLNGADMEGATITHGGEPITVGDQET